MNLSPIKMTLLASLLMAGASSAMAAAPTAVINVNGNITNNTCTLSAQDFNKTITLSSNGDSALQNATTLIPTPFGFSISGCSGTLTKVSATVDGTAVDSDVAGYGPAAVLASTGTAGNVGIGFLGSTDVGSTPAGALKLSQASAQAPVISGGAYISLAAQTVPLVQATLPTAGTVVGTATVTFNYS